MHSQEVGFHIYSLSSYECDLFKIYFHLWNRGGPNFGLEYNNWLKEEGAQWNLVTKKSPLTGANLVSLGKSPVLQPIRVLRPIQRLNLNFQKLSINAGKTAPSRFKGNKCPAFIPVMKGILRAILVLICLAPAQPAILVGLMAPPVSLLICRVPPTPALLLVPCGCTIHPPVMPPLLPVSVIIMFHCLLGLPSATASPFTPPSLITLSVISPSRPLHRALFFGV